MFRLKVTIKYLFDITKIYQLHTLDYITILLYHSIIKHFIQNKQTIEPLKCVVINIYDQNTTYKVSQIQCIIQNLLNGTKYKQ